MAQTPNSGSAMAVEDAGPVEKRLRGPAASDSPMAVVDGQDRRSSSGSGSDVEQQTMQVPAPPAPGLATREIPGTVVGAAPAVDAQGGSGTQSCEMRDSAACESADADSTPPCSEPTQVPSPSSKMNVGSSESGSDTDAAASHPEGVAAAGPAPAAVPCRSRDKAPVLKLSVCLIDTYNHINQVYYAKQREKKKANDWDNAKGDYIVRDGDVIQDGRYRLQKVIGSGSFGQVVKAHDSVTNCAVAIKIIKNKPAFHKQAKTEVELLEELNRAGSAALPHGRDANIVHLLGHFVHRDHMCLVFELLSYNLYDLLRLTKFRGVSLNLIRKFGKQIIASLYVLAEARIIHCDLKPENILLRHPKRSAIKVIDFGSSCRDTKTMYTYIQSRYYRAPEVILGVKYTVAIDMWSLGCTLMEMHTGEPLFGGQNEGDQLKKIVEIMGPLPVSLTDRASQKKRKLIPIDVTHTKDLPEIVADAKLRNRDKEDHTDEDYNMFLDLIRRMLTYEPEERITPIAALQHPFLQGHSPRFHAAAGGSSAPPVLDTPPLRGASGPATDVAEVSAPSAAGQSSSKSLRNTDVPGSK